MVVDGLDSDQAQSADHFHGLPTSKKHRRLLRLHGELKMRDVMGWHGWQDRQAKEVQRIAANKTKRYKVYPYPVFIHPEAGKMDGIKKKGTKEWEKPKEVMDRIMSIPSMNEVGKIQHIGKVPDYVVVTRATKPSGQKLVCAQMVKHGKCSINGLKPTGRSNVNNHALTHRVFGDCHVPYIPMVCLYSIS